MIYEVSKLHNQSINQSTKVNPTHLLDQKLVIYFSGWQLCTCFCSTNPRSVQLQAQCAEPVLVTNSHSITNLYLSTEQETNTIVTASPPKASVNKICFFIHYYRIHSHYNVMPQQKLLEDGKKVQWEGMRNLLPLKCRNQRELN